MEQKGLVYVLILNWNGCEDTIECIRSIKENNYSNYRIVVCDNASEDGSVERIKSWAEENSMEFDEIDGAQAESGVKWAELLLINTGENLGFAGGNNVGLRYILARNDYDFVWVLNNDTIVDENSIVELVNYSCMNSQYGVIGSKVLYYDNPNMIQVEGGSRYCKWLASISDFDSSKFGQEKSHEYLESRLDYIYGAAMFLTKAFIEKVGLMEEKYFLYCEELDWCIRGKYCGFRLGYCIKSRVFHKIGRSIGSASSWQLRSDISDYYANRSKLLLTKKFYWYALPFVYIRLIISACLRVFYGKSNRAHKILKMLIKSMLGREI